MDSSILEFYLHVNTMEPMYKIRKSQNLTQGENKSLSVTADAEVAVHAGHSTWWQMVKLGYLWE